MNKEKNREINFTEGNIYKKILLFAVPLLIGNLLQQVYFVADSIIVGKLIGSNALAAVGAATSITVVIIFFFQGIASGGGILISQFVGSGEINKISKTIKVAAIFTLVLGVICSLIGFLLTENILKWINVPANVFDETYKYLAVSFLGAMIPMLCYNMGASVMRALGDSKTPLYYLMVASAINIFLDIIFVKYIGMGVEGTAVATVIAQSIAATLIFINIYKRQKSNITKKREDNIFALDLFKQMIKIGMPIGVQDVVITFSGVIMQRHINGIGSDAMAGWSIFSRIDTFVILPFISFGIATMTFVGQNYGARKIDRIFKGVREGITMSVGVTIVLGVIVALTSENLFNFFTHEEAVIEYANDMIWNMVPFYFLLAMTRVYSSAVSGTGNSIVPMATNIIFMCVTRIILVPIFANVIGQNMESMYYAYWISWVLSFVSIYSYYMLKTKKQLKVSEGMV